MKPTDFAYHLSRYLNGFLAGQRNLSSNTISSYKEAFKLFIRFFRKEKGILPECLTISMCSKELVIEFTKWLKDERNSSYSTCNQRLAAIKSFFTYLQDESPEHLFLCQGIIKIRESKKTTENINYIPFEGVKSILLQPDQTERHGLRDLTILALLYDTGARVQEIVDLRVRDLRLEKPPGVNLLGKGRKWRHISLMAATADLLAAYLSSENLLEESKQDNPLFANHSRRKLTRAGIAYILNKYVNMARKDASIYIPTRVSPHTFRHSKAMHLLQSGINLIYIRDFLGHSDVKTTEIYARADSKAKREALESVYKSPNPEGKPSWTEDAEIMKMLKSLS